MCARAGTGELRSRPLAVHWATVTAGLRRIRRALCESASVITKILPASATNHTGVATPVPSRLKVVRLRYLRLNCGGGGLGWLRPAGSTLGRRGVLLALMAASSLSGTCCGGRGGRREVGLVLQLAECQVAADQAHQRRGLFRHGSLRADQDRGPQQALDGSDDEQGPFLVTHRPVVPSRRLFPANDMALDDVDDQAASLAVCGREDLRATCPGDGDSPAPGGQSDEPYSQALGLGGRAAPRPPAQPAQGAFPCSHLVLATPCRSPCQADHLA